ncbi:hypothetical protein BSL78_20792 [Apostichopus japonicus]|uniref:Uncharacterized protein n=1 Tax=Stichopus japonicus TaxID=307972 RepID=A0A2G8K323_STIJA|nr:hypothetical protein BSL78_20792 [Apostichopus japonicus]
MVLMQQLLLESNYTNAADLSHIQMLEEKIYKLKEDKRVLRAENKNLRRTIRLMDSLPELLQSVEKLRKETPIPKSIEEEAPVCTPVKLKDDLPSGVQKVNKILARCNVMEPAKMVNDILIGTFSEEYLSSHSITGTNGTTKEPMDPVILNEIICKYALNALVFFSYNEIIGPQTLIF